MNASRAARPATEDGSSLLRDAAARLPDGRVLAYTDLGHPADPVVLYFHGAPGSRLDLTVFAASLTASGVRVVSPDRPGYGRSSPQAGRHREDWPADVAALADHLDIERFAVMGASSGGHYALACAALLPERVNSAAVVCGETDFGWAEAWDGYPDSDEAVLLRMDDEAEAIAWCEARYSPDGDGFPLELAELPPADRAAMKDDALATALTTTMAEAFRQGVSGYATDVVVQGRPWAFDPGAIVAPVRILHGGADTLTPVAHAHHTAEVVPTAELTIRPEDGHISILLEIPKLAADLAGTAR